MIQDNVNRIEKMFSIIDAIRATGKDFKEIVELANEMEENLNKLDDNGVARAMHKWSNR